MCTACIHDYEIAPCAAPHLQFGQLDKPHRHLVSFPDPNLKRERVCSLFPRSHHAGKERVWGHWHRFLVQQAHQSHDYLHRFVLAYVQSRDGAQDQENAPMSPDPFPRRGWSQGMRQKLYRKAIFLCTSFIYVNHASQVSVT